MRLLDLFCGAGGAAMGYYRAGFDEIVGVDIEPQKHYPFTFVQADAMTFPLDGFDAIHASPPCQNYARSRYISPNGRHNGREYPRLIAPVRKRLERTSLPWIIENVEDARPDMPDAVMLCGTSLGLCVWRHLLFASNVMLMSAGPCCHRAGDVSVRRQHCEYIGIGSGVTYQDAKGYTRKRPKNATKAVCAAAMGIDWMTMNELGEAIPPAYTEWLGAQLLAAIETSKAA